MAMLTRQTMCGGTTLRFRPTLLIFVALTVAIIGAASHFASRRVAVPSPVSPSRQPVLRSPALSVVAATVGRIETGRMQAHIAKLAGGIGARRQGTKAEQAAANVVRQQLTSYGYTVRTESFTLPNGLRSANVIAKLPGASEQVLLIGAHLDSRASSPGANDNASGVAVLLETARVLRASKPPCTLLFVGFGAEEHQRRGERYHHFGSRALAKNAGLRKRLAGMVSLDMVGYGTVLHVDNQGWAADRRRDAIGTIAGNLGLPVRVGRSKPQSDHEAFERLGIPVAYLHWERDPTYHRPADAPAHIQPQCLRRTAELMVRAVLNAQ